MHVELSIESIIKIRKPAYGFPYSVSPNGRWLAFTSAAASRPETTSKGISSVVAGCSLYVYDLKNKKGFEMISYPNRSSWSGVWSPVEDTLAFYCDLDGEAGLWLWNAESGVVRVSKQVVRPFFGFEFPVWTPDGRSIIVKSMPDEEIDHSSFGLSVRNEYQKEEPISIYRSGDLIEKRTEVPPETWLSRYRADIVRIDPLTGEPQFLACGFRPLGMAISPDGTQIVFADAIGLESPGIQQVTYDLWITSIEPSSGEEPRCIAKGVFLLGPTFTWYDVRTIIYTTAGPLADGGLWAVDIGGESAPYRIAFSEKIPFHREFDPPLKLTNGDVLIVAKEKLWRIICETSEIVNVIPNWNRHILAVIPMDRLTMIEQDKPYIIIQTREPKEEMDGFYRLDLLNGQMELLCEEQRKHYPWYIGGAAFCRIDHRDKLIYLAESETKPPALYILDIETKEVEKIGDLNPGIFPEDLGTVRMIKWKLGERHLKGILMLPFEHSDELVPVIVRAYGGEMQSRQLRYFGCSPWSFENHHLFTSRGFAVFLPDLPVSGHDPAVEIYQGLDAAMHELVLQPEIDRDRIGIIGHSFGGYTALVGVSRLKWFKVAVVSAGIADLISFAAHFDPKAPKEFFAMVENGQFRLQYTLWENQQRYITNSPLFEFDRIEVPILLLQGTNDTLCAAQAGPILAALRRLNKTAELVFYHGEDHSPVYWKSENIKDYLERVVNWFREYLV
jgi:pimeloyl-ACP methyl ester carboxylesterase